MSGKFNLLNADNVGDMRARDVRAHLKGHVDERVMFVLESLAEKLHIVDKGLSDLILINNQICDMLPGLVGVAENMKKTIENIRDAAGDPTLGMLSTKHDGAPE